MSGSSKRTIGKSHASYSIRHVRRDEEELWQDYWKFLRDEFYY